jgi:hypothetical protein
MVVHYIDVVFTETSGFAIRGEDFRLAVPLTCPINDVLLLSGVGLSSTSWVSFGGDLNVSRNLAVSGNTNISGSVGVATISTNAIYVDIINTNNASEISVNNDILLTNGYTISGYEAHFTNIYGTNYYGLTTNNLQITVTQGWKPIQQASITVYTPNFTSWKYSLDNNTNHASLSTDTMIVVNISSTDYRCYGELEGTVNGLKVAGARVGNMGLLPNSNVEHALKSNLWIDNESTFTFVAPSGQSWSINTLSGYYDVANPDANLKVSVTLYEQALITTHFAGDMFNVSNIMVNNLSTENLAFTNSDVVTADGTFYSTGTFLTLNITGSTLYIPLYKG